MGTDVEKKGWQAASLAMIAAPVLQRRGWKMAPAMRARCDWLIERSEASDLDPMQVANWNFKTRGVR